MMENILDLNAQLATMSVLGICTDVYLQGDSECIVSRCAAEINRASQTNTKIDEDLFEYLYNGLLDLDKKSVWEEVRSNIYEYNDNV